MRLRTDDADLATKSAFDEPDICISRRAFEGWWHGPSKKATPHPRSAGVQPGESHARNLGGRGARLIAALVARHSISVPASQSPSRLSGSVTGNESQHPISKQTGDRPMRFKNRQLLRARRNDNLLVLAGGTLGEWTPHDLRRTAVQR